MNVEEAIGIALEAVKKHFGGSEHRLEEIEIQENGGCDITISYRSPDSPRPLTLGSEGLLSGMYGKRAAIGVDASRSYKDVLVTPDGQVKAIRMRQIVLG